MTLLYAHATQRRAESGEFAIQQFMMRLSSNLRRYRWAVFAAWLLLLVPSIYLAMHQSGNLTGGGFEVEGSQSLHVQPEPEQHFTDQGPSAVALVPAPRAGASFGDITPPATPPD